ncbi:MAG: PaaI family thioesterase [Alphaproteobacteria bacterium]
MNARPPAEPTAPLPGYELYDPIDPFENHAGPFFWRRREDGSHHFVLRAETHHCNTHKIVHGGLMMTMIDLALCAAAKAATDGQPVITVSMANEFLDAGREGELIEASAELLRGTGSMVFVRGQLHVGDRVILNSSAVVKKLRRG